VKKIVLVSSGQPSVNPRLVKEANALVKEGYQVTVIYSYWTDWAWEMDKQLFKSVSWKPILAGGSPYENKFIYFVTRIRFKLFTFIANKLTLKYGVAEIAKGRATIELFKKAKAIKANFYIAHNLAALPVVVKASKLHKVKCGFDAEDFHRQEVSDSLVDFNYRIVSFLEDKYLLVCAYISAASPLIAKAYQQLYPQVKPVVINNVFELKFLQEVNDRNEKQIKLFWFSQTIGKNRGLEDVIEALNTLNNNDIQLHLLGKVSEEIKAYFNELIKNNKGNLFFHEPILPEEIFTFSKQFDVGLALEPGFCYNNKIALSNKLFSYLLSGLAIVASNTLAQKAFIEENEGVGLIYSIGYIEELASKINFLFQNRAILNDFKKEASRLAMEKFNWEKEELYFLENINSLVC